MVTKWYENFSQFFWRFSRLFLVCLAPWFLPVSAQIFCAHSQWQSCARAQTQNRMRFFALGIFFKLCTIRSRFFQFWDMYMVGSARRILHSRSLAKSALALALPKLIDVALALALCTHLQKSKRPLKDILKSYFNGSISKHPFQLWSLGQIWP
jgi:hypothetical protein